MRSSIEAYLNSKDWTFKYRNGEFALDLCPLCNASPGHFYLNESKEIFYCHKCGERGHILSLKKRLGDLPAVSHVSSYSKFHTPSKTIEISLIEKYHRDLLDNPAALAYLTDERAFSLDTIKKFKLGFKDGAITIPHLKDGLCLNIKSRSLGIDKKYFREAGYPSILFNVDHARKYDEVIITEGEFDAIAFDQMGFPCVVSVPNGAEAFSDEWVEDLEPFGKIYLSYDMDDAGRKGVEKAADKLGMYRCVNVVLSVKDGNECLKAGFTYPEMGEILAKAKPFDSPMIKVPGAFYDEIRAIHEGRSETQGTLTGWTEFDKLLGGLRPNELTILTGETGSGKTTWAVNSGYRLSQNDHPVLIASFEMKPGPILKKMIQAKAGRPLTELKKSDLDSSLQHISSLPLFFVDAYGEIGIKELRDSVFYAKRRHGVKFVILDHLHFFLKFSGDHERQAIDSGIKDIKSWAMELGIHIILIVHPTKLEVENRPIRLNDLKGSSGLKQIPDNVLSIWRPRGEDDLKKTTGEVILYVLKCRDDSGDEGKVILTFDKRSQSYSDSGHGNAIPSEGVRTPASSPRSRPDRSWVNGYEQ